MTESTENATTLSADEEREDDAVVLVRTVRFGEVSVPRTQVLEMSSPILGFAASKRYCILPPTGGDDSPFRWLQSMDDDRLAFVVVNPFDYFPDYDIEIPTPDQRELELETSEDCAVLAIVTIPEGNPTALTANLVAPLVINARTKRARQVVLYESGYCTRHYLLPEEARTGAAPESPPDTDEGSATE